MEYSLWLQVFQSNRDRSKSNNYLSTTSNQPVTLASIFEAFFTKSVTFYVRLDQKDSKRKYGDMKIVVQIAITARLSCSHSPFHLPNMRGEIIFHTSHSQWKKQKLFELGIPKILTFVPWVSVLSESIIIASIHEGGSIP